MPLGRGLSGSEVKYYTALSAGHFAEPGSSNPVNLSRYEWATMILTAGCVNNLTVSMARSATSDGTFSQFGASINLTAGSGQTRARSFSLVSSAVFYQLQYDSNDAGSTNAAVIIEATNPRHTPIDQESTTQVLSSII